LEAKWKGGYFKSRKDLGVPCGAGGGFFRVGQGPKAYTKVGSRAFLIGGAEVGIS